MIMHPWCDGHSIIISINFCGVEGRPDVIFTPTHTHTHTHIYRNNTTIINQSTTTCMQAHPPSKLKKKKII